MSLFERLQRSGHPGALLDVQYRMHREISQFPSGAFYSGELRDAPSVPTHPPFPPGVVEIFARPEGNATGRKGKGTSGSGQAAYLADLRPYVFLDLAAGKETRISGSYANEHEADYVAALVAHLQRTCRATSGPSGHRTEHGHGRGGESEGKSGVDIGVITPYAAQRSELARRLLGLGGSAGVSADGSGGSVEVNTVDGFQARTPPTLPLIPSPHPFDPLSSVSRLPSARLSSTTTTEHNTAQQ